MTAPERRAISAIHVGSRARKDMGDIAELAESIRTQGLLQAIGVLEDNTLVFGERRLRACRDILGWTEIDVRVVNVTNVVVGEMHENEMRKQFTPSERAAIFKTIDTIGSGGDHTSKRPRGDVCSPVTTDEAAKLAGFAGRGTAYRATTVVERGIPEVVTAMDEGVISITAAEEVAKQPKPEQPEKLAAAIETSRKRQAKKHQAKAGNGKAKAKTKRKRQKAEWLDTSHIVNTPPTLSQEEAGFTPDMTFDERLAHQEKYGKAQIVPKAVRDMRDCEALVSHRVDSLQLLIGKTLGDAAAFMNAINSMAAWTTDQRKDGYVGYGWETDFAKIAAKQMTRLRELLPQARALLATFEAALATLEHGPAMQSVTSGNGAEHAQ